MLSVVMIGLFCEFNKYLDGTKCMHQLQRAWLGNEILTFIDSLMHGTTLPHCSFDLLLCDLLLKRNMVWTLGLPRYIVCRHVMT